MNSLFFLTIVSVITYITSKQCTVSFVDANPAFTNPRQCYNATALVVKETQKLEYKVEMAPCADKQHNCMLPFQIGGTAEGIIKADQPAFCENYHVLESRLPGESCNHDLECYSQECQSGVCRGRAYNQTCEEQEFGQHAQCDVGLVCREKKYPVDGEHKPVHVCVPQISNNHTACSEDEHCSNEKGCNLVYGPDRGICVDYYSLSNFEIASKKELCQSNYLDTRDNRCKDILLIPEDKKSTSTFECIGDNDKCLYQIVGRNAYDPKKPIQNDVVSQNCLCSRSADPKSFCPLDTIGAKGLAVKEEAKKRIVTGVHTYRRYDDTKLSKDYYFPNYEQATDNVFKTNQKFDAHTSSSSFIKMSLLALLLVFAL